MENSRSGIERRASRRSFLRTGTWGVGAALGTGMLPQELARAEEDYGPLNRVNTAILKFLSALEQVEADLWIQYAELGGAVTQGVTFSPIDLPFKTGLAPNYITALQVLDGDMPQYIADNTDDEISHHRFLNNYLMSKGAQPIDLSTNFAILPPSQVTGVPQTGRLSNLKQLTIDTTWWTRYRSATANPDFGGAFENAVPDLAKGQHPAIPLTDADLALNSDGTIPNHLQAIASTAGFHFAFIEQGGSSLYPALAQKASTLEVLRLLLSIGGAEIMHFVASTGQAGSAPAVTDGALVFPDLGSGPFTGEDLKKNLIMPEPCQFVSGKLPPCSIIRPTATPGGGAVAAIAEFIEELFTLAAAADRAKREL